MTAPASAAQVRGWPVIRIALIVVVVAGLAIDAYVHFDLASNYRLIKTSTLSQADLFRAEGAVAIIAALLLLVSRRCMSPSGTPRRLSPHTPKAQRCLPPCCFFLCHGRGRRRPLIIAARGRCYRRQPRVVESRGHRVELRAHEIHHAQKTLV